MSDGGAQRAKLFLGSNYAGFTIDFTAAGTDTGKDAWVDENKSTAVQQITADIKGMASWFADGDYKLVIKDSDGAILWTWDNFKITSDTATMWEGNIGFSFPTANSTNIGQLFMTWDYNILKFLGVNTRSSFQTCCQPIGIGADIEPVAGT